MRPIQLGDDFTLGELGNFTLGELSLPVDELLELIRSENRSIPVSAYEKLLKIAEENGIKLTKHDNLPEQLNILLIIIQIITTLLSVNSSNHPVNIDVDYYLSDSTYYSLNETQINDITEQLKHDIENCLKQ